MTNTRCLTKKEKKSLVLVRVFRWIPRLNGWCVSSKGKGWNVQRAQQGDWIFHFYKRHYKWVSEVRTKVETVYLSFKWLLPLLTTPHSAHICLHWLAERKSAAHHGTQSHPILQIRVPRESWGRQGWPVMAKWGTSRGRAKGTRAFFKMNSFPAFTLKSIDLYFPGKTTKTMCVNSKVLGIDPSEVVSSLTTPHFRMKHLKWGHSQGSSTPASFLNINTWSAELSLHLRSADAFWNESCTLNFT